MPSQHTQALEALMALFGGVKTAMQHTLAAQGKTSVPPMVLRVLSLCVQRPGITQQALVDHTGRDKAQIARLVKVLLAEGLLERQAHPQDKRSHCLWPTPAAADAVKAFKQAQTRIASHLFKGVDATQLQSLIREWQALGQKLKHFKPRSGS